MTTINERVRRADDIARQYHTRYIEAAQHGTASEYYAAYRAWARASDAAGKLADVGESCG